MSRRHLASGLRCDALVIYREYPHTDMADRARDLYRLVAETVAGRIRPTMAPFDCRMMGIYPTNPQTDGAVAPIMQQIPLVRIDPRKYPRVEDPFADP